jgi:FG-GAP repeat
MRGGAPPHHAATGRTPVWLGTAIPVPVSALSAAAALAAAMACLFAAALHPAPRDGVPASRAASPLSSTAVGPVHVRFTPSGVHLQVGATRLSLRLGSVGGDAGAEALPAVAPVSAPKATEYLHPGIAEWYVRSARGLEQGFSIPRPPRGTSPAGRLDLRVDVTGNARLSMSHSGKSVLLTGPAGVRLRYGQLHATDANGRDLEGRLSLRSGAIMIVVEARGARYPLRIDPLIQQGEKLVGGEQEDGQAQFGSAVALSADGTTALVGAPRNHPAAGAVWVFTRAGSAWLQQGSPLNSGGPETEPGPCEAEPEEPGDCGFGASVALSADGNTALIGSPITTEPCSEPAGVCSGQGAASVYVRSGTTWTQQGPPLTGGEEETPSAHFGRSVALSADGNTALVAAPGDHAHHGAVWTFVRSGSSWTQLGPKITPGKEGLEDFFGAGLAVSADGSTALVGGPGNFGGDGAAWVFARSGSGWTQQGSKLTGRAEESGLARFGRSVAISQDGSLALVGGFADNAHTGAAWTFARSGSVWTQVGTKLTASEEVGHALFGRSVALAPDGSSALIGGPGDSAKEGAAWAFTRTSEGWTQSGRKLMPQEIVGNSWFGYAVALSALSEVALIGGPNNAAELGAAWTFAQGPEPSPEPSPVEEPPRKKKSKEPPSVAPPGVETDPGSGGVPTTGVGGTSVSPFGPLKIAPRCGPSLASGAVTVDARGRASIKLRLAGAGACRGRVTLTIKKAVAHHRSKLVTIGSTSFSLSAGRTVSLALALNKLGRALLRARHGKLTASLTLLRLYPAPVSARTASVRLSVTHKSAPKH